MRGLPEPASKQTDRLPRYAILFKVHAWDDFHARQLQRVQTWAGAGDVFVMCDDTRGPVQGIAFGQLIRVTEDAVVQRGGYLHYPPGQLFWYNTDYQLYHFIDLYPEYQYVVTIEYDCSINFPVDDIVRRMDAEDLGFVGERIGTPSGEWLWTPRTLKFYPDFSEISGRLLCFSAYSRAFACQLQAARRDHAERVESGAFKDIEEIPWPNNEAFVGAEIARLGIRERPLSDFARTFFYNWAPPYPESVLERLDGPAIVHPVLDRPRHLSAIAKIGWKIEDIFQPQSKLRDCFETFDLAEGIALYLLHMAAKRDWSDLDNLKRYTVERGADPAGPLFDVARGKPATQSTVSPWSHFADVALDAAGAVAGEQKQGYGFHTHLHEPSWWSVDLKTAHPVAKIRIRNRDELRDRANSLVVTASNDMVAWQELYRHAGQAHFGAADADALVIDLSPALSLRFLRIHLEESELLHLKSVEIFV